MRKSTSRAGSCPDLAEFVPSRLTASWLAVFPLLSVATLHASWRLERQLALAELEHDLGALDGPLRIETDLVALAPDLAPRLNGSRWRLDFESAVVARDEIRESVQAPLENLEM